MILLDSLTKTYSSVNGTPDVCALNGVSLTIARGEFIVIRGPSGCGKTTLLSILGGMMRPSSGTYSFDNQNLYDLSVHERARFRATRIGFVFQMFHLVHYLNVYENVRLACRSTGNSGDDARTLIDSLGLSHRMSHTPAALSAGEKQRTAIARALVNRPALVLADEPTGNLDPDNAVDIYRHLHDYNQQGGTVLVVTHGTLGDEYATSILRMKDGRLCSE